MIRKILNSIVAAFLGAIAFVALSYSINLIIGQVITGDTMRSIVNAVLISPVCAYLAAVVSKRICGDAYFFYALLIALELGTAAWAVRQGMDLIDMPSQLTSSVTCFILYYFDMKNDRAARKAEAEKRAARIDAGLPPTEEEEEELRRAAEIEEAIHPEYDPETWDDTLYNENEPDMWDVPVEDEEEFLHEEYHGAYEDDEAEPAESVDGKPAEEAAGGAAGAGEVEAPAAKKEPAKRSEEPRKPIQVRSAVAREDRPHDAAEGQGRRRRVRKQ